MKRRESQGNLRGDQQCRYRGLGPVNKGRTHVRKNAWNERPVGSGHQLDVGQEREMEESKKAPNLQVSIQGDVVSVTRERDVRNSLTGGGRGRVWSPMKTEQVLNKSSGKTPGCCSHTEARANP